MDPIIVRRHGGRWAVQDGPHATPRAEYETRELAEVAARQDAGGREVIIQEDSDDARLGLSDGVREGGEVHWRDPASIPETPREPQAGL
jgi:hypothetical protein